MICWGPCGLEGNIRNLLVNCVELILVNYDYFVYRAADMVHI